MGPPLDPEHLQHSGSKGGKRRRGGDKPFLAVEKKPLPMPLQQAGIGGKQTLPFALDDSK